MSQRVYIGRIFSRQVYEKDMSKIYNIPYNSYPWQWPYDCDGKLVYYYADDEQKRLYIEDDDNYHYRCHIDWTKPEAFKARDCNNCTYCNLNEQDKPCANLIEGELCKYYEASK